jgi:hypothetical protein
MSTRPSFRRLCPLGARGAIANPLTVRDFTFTELRNVRSRGRGVHALSGVRRGFDSASSGLANAERDTLRHQFVSGMRLAEGALMATTEKSNRQSVQASSRSSSQKSGKSSGSAGSASQRGQGRTSEKNDNSKSQRKQSAGSSARR